ncbi:MAG: methylenetetrahydrofolate reductase [Anaerolineae bacterium]|nr:methylenetetrahydrofolate reductase [Anaerolineae bacterium]
MTDNNGKETIAGSNLEKVLRAGHFAVTGELGPPTGADRSVISEKAEHLKGIVDAVNITDNQTAVARMSSIAVGAMLVNLGLEPVIQMTVRDRNRLAIQADLFGAWALGARNLLCLTGDHMTFGNHPETKGVYDMDSVQLLQMMRDMGEKGVAQSGDELEEPPSFFLGAAANPFAPPYEYRPYRLAKKVQAGAKFIQTQCTYNLPRFKEYMQRAGDLGLLDDVYVMMGVTPLKSTGMAWYMANNVPGLDVPEDVVKRMRAAVSDIPKEDKKARSKAQREEGIQICVETIQQAQEIPGVSGVHIMAIEWEPAVSVIAEKAGLLPRPTV